MKDREARIETCDLRLRVGPVERELEWLKERVTKLEAREELLLRFLNVELVHNPATIAYRGRKKNG